MKKTFLLLIIFVLILLVIGGSSLTGSIIMNSGSKQDAFYLYKSFSYPSNVTIIEGADDLYVGVSIDNDNLNFGIIPTGGSYGTRIINIKNDENVRVKVTLDSSGDIKPYIEFSSNNFYLDPEEDKAVDVVFRTQETTDMGDYSGEIHIITRRPKTEFLSPILNLF